VFRCFKGSQFPLLPVDLTLRIEALCSDEVLNDQWKQTGDQLEDYIFHFLSSLILGFALLLPRLLGLYCLFPLLLRGWL
jgi:hypothetical protein